MIMSEWKSGKPQMQRRLIGQALNWSRWKILSDTWFDEKKRDSLSTALIFYFPKIFNNEEPVIINAKR